MRYIKLFEQQWQQPDRTEELLDFTNDYLAYLMDDGFKFQVNSADFTSDVYEVIRIRKGDNPFYINGGDANLDKEQFTWDQIKDYMLPYLIMLDRRYTIEVVTFFTKKLGNSISFTKEGAAKIKDLLEEKTFPHYYNWSSIDNPRSQVFEEIRIKIKKLPLIYNRNESFDRWSRARRAELQDYCETNLAYLIDEGFGVRIGQNLVTNSKDYNNISITIIKGEKRTDREDFFWEEIKDQVIPFIMILEKKYDIQKIRFLSDDNSHDIRDNFEEELDNRPINKIRYIDIFLSDEKFKL